MEQKHKIFNLIILDESGSMQSIKNATISGFNEVVQTVKGVQKQFPEQEHFISLVTFNGLGIKTLLFNEPVNSLNEIDADKYQPGSLTPLYDAMGFSISKLRQAIKLEKDRNVLVTILTDGEENDSKEYSGKAIKGLVDELQEDGWTFTYIGANHDVESFAQSISIQNTMVFKANDKDMRQMFEKEKSARFAYSMKVRKKEDLKKDFYKDS